MWEALQFDFMRQAVVASVLVSILCGIMGSYIVVNRISFISGGIAHAAYGGVGASIFFGIPIMLGTGLFALAVGVLIAILSFRHKERVDTIIGVIWALGMAVGVILLDKSPGFKGDILSYLFGNILLVNKTDTYALLAIDVVAIILISVFYKEFMAISFDREFAMVIGIPTLRLYILLICLISISIVTIIKIVGILLVVALLTIPPLIAEKFVKSLGKMMVLSSFFIMFFSILGLQISYKFNLPAGACIIIVASLSFLITRFLK